MQTVPSRYLEALRSSTKASTAALGGSYADHASAGIWIEILRFHVIVGQIQAKNGRGHDVGALGHTEKGRLRRCSQSRIQPM